MSTATAFKPNAMTFKEGVERLTAAAEKIGFDWQTRITTSRDPNAKSAVSLLRVANVPAGFTKFQLPVFMRQPSQLFVSVGVPDTDVPEHSHDEGDGFRYIVAGSIIYDGKELAAGDWMYIPARKRYAFKVGPYGATMLYCYECCCA